MNQPAPHFALAEMSYPAATMPAPVATMPAPVAAIPVIPEVPAPSLVNTDPVLSPDEPVVYAETVPSVETTPTLAPTPIVVHAAELRGRVELHAGKRLTIEPLVITSNTYPVPGCLAHLWIETPAEDGVADWKHFAEARVATPLLFGSPMELEILEDSAEVDEDKPTRPVLQKGVRVRVQWEW
ncbi:MAG TPA: hypothetical protein PK156_27205 [Polyangium sp.]|nr:hypothetical protein [Polyangium sp.]